jgi:hypothetical protein
MLKYCTASLLEQHMNTSLRHSRAVTEITSWLSILLPPEVPEPERLLGFSWIVDKVRRWYNWLQARSDGR